MKKTYIITAKSLIHASYSVGFLHLNNSATHILISVDNTHSTYQFESKLQNTVIMCKNSFNPLSMSHIYSTQF